MKARLPKIDENLNAELLESLEAGVIDPAREESDNESEHEMLSNHRQICSEMVRFTPRISGSLSRKGGVDTKSDDNEANG